MEQVCNIKKVQVDSEMKVSIILEFTASTEGDKEALFELIRLQGNNTAKVTFEPSQLSLNYEAEAVGI